MGRLVAVLCSAFVIGAFGPVRGADEKDDKDAKALQGVWAYESMEWNGKKIPADQIKESTLTIDGNKFTVKRGKEVAQAGTIKFDSIKSQKTFDVTVTEGEGKGSIMLGIYKIDGDTITVCLSYTGTVRPTEYKTAEQSDSVVVTAKRVKK
jgi:uncharacterized protein (TIGR03067 family)